MEIFRSILIIFITVSGVCVGLMVFVYVYSPRGVAASEILRTKTSLAKEKGKQSLNYWINAVYLWHLENFLRIFIIFLGILIISILALRIFAN